MSARSRQPCHAVRPRASSNRLRRALQRRHGAAAGWSLERWRLAQQDDAASLDWPQHPTCGTDLRSLRGRVDGGDDPQRLVLIHHLEWKQTLHVACSLPACAAGEQTNKQATDRTNKQATASRQETAGPLAVPRHGQPAL